MCGFVWPRRALAAAAAILFGFVQAPGALASSFQINPVLVEVRPDKTAATVTIDNQDDKPVVVRVRVMSWRQADGADVYDKTDEILMSPPLARIAAHGKQIIRLGPKNRDRSAERAYRVVIEEVPAGRGPRGTVSIALSFNLPLYVLSAQRGVPDVAWKAWREKNGQIAIEATNRGSTRADIQDLGWAAASGEGSSRKGRAGVVLANGSRLWRIGESSALRAGGPLTLKFRMAGGTGEREVPVTLQDR